LEENEQLKKLNSALSSYNELCKKYVSMENHVLKSNEKLVIENEKLVLENYSSSWYYSNWLLFLIVVAMLICIGCCYKSF
jgi:hypothetical protein